jgi:hypothetical protein
VVITNVSAADGVCVSPGVVGLSVASWAEAQGGVLISPGVQGAVFMSSANAATHTARINIKEPASFVMVFSFGEKNFGSSWNDITSERKDFITL